MASTGNGLCLTRTMASGGNDLCLIRTMASSWTDSCLDWTIRFIFKPLFTRQGSCPESLVVCGQARLFGVAGSNPPGSVSTSLSDSSVSLTYACGVITPCI